MNANSIHRWPSVPEILLNRRRGNPAPGESRQTRHHLNLRAELPIEGESRR